MRKKPRDVIAVYESKDDVSDPFSIVLGSDFKASPGMKSMLAVGRTPDFPPGQGLSQFTEGRIGAHLGKKIPWSQLPDDVQSHIARRLVQL